MKGSFSALLLEHIENTLKVNKQVILFQNRRGYAQGSYVHHAVGFLCAKNVMFP